MTLAEAWDFSVFGPWEENKSTDTEYKIVDDGDTIKIAFQGSSEFLDDAGKIRIDWKQNFDFRSVEYTGGERCHGGFYRKLMSVYMDILKRLDYKHKIEVYGFSQGAALASLMYRILKGVGFKVSGVVFGCPRIFKKLQVDDGYFDDLLRVEVKGDIISRVPPWLFGFRHYGPSKRLKSDRPFWDFYGKHMVMGRLVGGLDLLGGK